MSVIPFTSNAKFDIVELTSLAMAELLAGKSISSTGHDGKKSLELVIGLHLSEEQENGKISFPLSESMYVKDVRIA
jgi:hypothetical protein